MTDRMEWEGRVGRKWADEWRRTDRSFAGLTDRLLGRASARQITRALDVGCGAGELSLALARGHAGAEVVGLDVSADLVAAARERGGHLSNVRFEVADAAAWTCDGFTPDLLISRHGVMFFPDAVEAFAHLAGIAAPGARLVFSCFRDVSENPWAERITTLLPSGAVPEVDPQAPGPFAFADRDRVETILRTAGWREISFEKVDFAYIAGAGNNPVDDAMSYFLAIGPAARAAAQLSDADRATFVGKLRRFLANNQEGSLIALPAAAWIVSARGR